MGSCMSKCSRKRKRQDEDHNPNAVQDKLVITQAPISPISISSTKQLLSIPQSPTSIPSNSSFSCTNGNTTTTTNTSTSYSSTSLTSSSSLCSVSKERSFSNEFLISCVKENPHIVHPPKKETSVRSDFGAIPNKRARPSGNSPHLAHQKSFRRENMRPKSPHHTLSRSALRSPSPTHRNLGRCSIVDNSNVADYGVYKENLRLRPMSPRNDSTRNGPLLMNRNRYTHRIGSKIDEVVRIGDMLSYKQEDGGNLMEDIDNPLIALDCFIFL